MVSFPLDGQTAEELFESADRRHYIAKRAGRSRVISEDPGSAPNQFRYHPQIPSRVIERDQPMETLNDFLKLLPDRQRGLLTIYGLPGSGKSRFLAEARKIARLRGYAILSVKGSNAVKNRMYGSLDLARQEWDNIPPPSEGLETFTAAVQQSLVDKGNAGILITVDNQASTDRYSLEYLLLLFTQIANVPIGILYASEGLPSTPDALHNKLAQNAALNESVLLSPISAAGIRIWLRHSLHWEAPQDFIHWFHQETAGMPANIKRVLFYVVEHGLVSRNIDNEYRINTAHFNMADVLAHSRSSEIYNFPANLTAFIGREEELRTIKQLLPQHRMVTLLAQAGVASHG